MTNERKAKYKPIDIYKFFVPCSANTKRNLVQQSERKLKLQSRPCALLLGLQNMLPAVHVINDSLKCLSHYSHGRWQVSHRPSNTLLTFERTTADSESSLHSTYVHATLLPPNKFTRPRQDDASQSECVHRVQRPHAGEVKLWLELLMQISWLH